MRALRYTARARRAAARCDALWARIAARVSADDNASYDRMSQRLLAAGVWDSPSEERETVRITGIRRRHRLRVEPRPLVRLALRMNVRLACCRRVRRSTRDVLRRAWGWKT